MAKAKSRKTTKLFYPDGLSKALHDNQMVMGDVAENAANKFQCGNSMLMYWCDCSPP